ncbi:MAG: hypothetical protein KCHDKBKB_00115 [Elusimicrobia bacterium]|nr:hypothetical protein [Elusimicrobiota bacterium]
MTPLKLKAKSILSRLFLRYVGKGTQAILVSTEQGAFLVPASDLSMARALSLSGAYNKPLLESIQSQLNPSSRVLFVGTHVGTLLIPTSKKCAYVTGIEANPATFNLLEKNRLLHSVTNATLLHMAAFDKEGELEFLANRDNTGGSKVLQPTTNAPEFFYDNPRKIKVPAKRLDDVLPDQKFDLIVMDIEGSEYKALLGMPHLLEFSSKLILEIHPLGIEKSAGITPETLFSAIPRKFQTAIPLNTPHLEPRYTREQFTFLYNEIRSRYYSSGIDVLFE